jgi:uncharacterized protein
MTGRHLSAFLALTFLASWVCFPAATSSNGVRQIIYLLGVFAPALVALALTYRIEGTAGVSALLSRIAKPRASALWYVFAISYMALIKLAGAVVYRIALGTWPAFGNDPIYLMLGATLISTPVQAGEEIGWRGYALPRLERLIGLGPGSVVLGLVWAAWHLPFFLITGTDKSGQSFVVYAIGATAISVAMAWVYWRTDGSLLLVMLMHAAINNTKDLVPSPPVPPGNPFTLAASPMTWITAALLSVTAIVLLVQFPNRTRRSRKVLLSVRSVSAVRSALRRVYH